jgi:hypothetical protein
MEYAEVDKLYMGLKIIGMNKLLQVSKLQYLHSFYLLIFVVLLYSLHAVGAYFTFCIDSLHNVALS